MGIRTLIREFIKEMRETPNGTSPYDTVAEVKRIENGKAWVSIPGGVRETPVDIAGNVSVGDKVQVRVSGGRAWASGNYTDPPEGRKATRDTRKLAGNAMKQAGIAADGVNQLIVITDQQEEEIGAVIVTANGKNKTYHQATEPTGGEYAPGDIWFDTDDDNKMYRWDGSQWAAVTLGDDALASISANKITAGTIDASQITVSNLDAGNITSGYLAAARIEAGSLSISKTDGLQTALNSKADTDDAVLSEQLIYISKVSGTSSVSKNTTWVTSTSDSQNTWTLKRPTYSSSYPVLFVAKQSKTVDGTVSCTTPVKDDTTTVIDGGHITTGTIDAARLNINDIIAAGSIIVSGANISGLNNDTGFITADGVVYQNLLTNGYWDPDFDSAHPSWTKEASATMEFDDSTGLWKISCSSSYYGLTQTVTVDKNTDYVISAEVGTTFNLGFGSGSYPQYSGAWSTAADGRKYRVVNSGNNNSLTVYAYATSSNPCYINRIKVERGSTYTGWTAGAHEVEIAMGIAGNFLTTISGQTGICVHDVGDLTNFLNVKSGEVGIYVGGTKVATYGATDASIGEGSGTSSIGLCGDTFHLTGRQVTNAGLSGGVLCLDNDSTYTNKLMVVTTLTQSEEAGWFGTTSNIPNQDFGVMMVNKGSSDGGVFSVSTRKKNGKMANMALTPTQFVLGLNGTVSGNTATTDNNLSITTSMMTYSKDFKALGKVGTEYGYDNPVSTSINVHITENGYLYRTTASSRKIKKEITDIKEGDLAPEKLYDLPIRQFKYRKDRLGEEDMRYETFIPGFIAEEVAEVYPIAADLDSKGEPEDWNVRYVVPPMLALIQRQKRAIDGLTERIETIEGRMM